MTLSIELYWSFRSPYSYLATGRLVAMQRDYDLDIAVRPVLPIAIRKGEFFTQVNPMWIPYLLRDTARIAEMLGLPYAWPRPDPVVTEPGTFKAAKDQPYAPRLTRLGCAAAERGKGLAFLDEVSKVIWSGTQNWDQGDHLTKAAARAGLDLAELEAAVNADIAKYDAVIETNQKAQADAGHWGVPLMVFKGEPFFGQDRLDLLLWRLKQNGLQPRN